MFLVIRVIQELFSPVNADFIPDPSSQNRTRIPTLAVSCDRYLITDYAGACIATAALSVITLTKWMIKVYEMQDIGYEMLDKTTV